MALSIGRKILKQMLCSFFPKHSSCGRHSSLRETATLILRDGKRAEGTAGRKTEGTTPAGQAKAGEDSAPSNNSGNRPCLYMWGVQHWFNCVKQCDKPSIHGFVGLVFATKLAKTMNKQP